MVRITLLDYGAGNVKSLYNALVALGCDVEQTDDPARVSAAAVLLFPGVGAFGACMAMLERKKLVEPLRVYIRAGRPFLGICLGMQTLFEYSEESPGVAGLGIVPGTVGRFNVAAHGLSVPQIGWNGIAACQVYYDTILRNIQLRCFYPFARVQLEVFGLPPHPPIITLPAHQQTRPSHPPATPPGVFAAGTRLSGRRSLLCPLLPRTRLGRGERMDAM